MYTLGALLLLSVLLGAVIAVVKSVLELARIHDTIHKLPIIGEHLGLIIAILVVWYTKTHTADGWGVSFEDDWMTYVANGAIIYGMIPVKDAVISMVGKGLRA